MRESFSKFLCRKASGFLKASRRFAFNVPEVLITAALVGAAAVLVIGATDKTIQGKKMELERISFNNEIAVVTADMQAEGKLEGYKDQESFNNALSKYYPVVEIPENELSSRFAETYKNEDGSEFSAKDFENHVITPSGVSFAYTYNTNYHPLHQFSENSLNDKKINGNYTYEIKNEALSSLKGFYDVNGSKGPNQLGKDVMLLTEFKRDCLDENGNITKFIPNAFGKCPNDSDAKGAKVCSRTEFNCKAGGSLKTLNRKTCDCECHISCPVGETLDENSCTCSCKGTNIQGTICKKEDGITDNPYADCEASKGICGCMPKNPNAPKLCEEDGRGHWNSEKCRCECTDAFKEKVKNEYHGYAEPDENDYCRVKCITNDEKFKEQLKVNAEKGNPALVADAIQLTKRSTLSDKCYTCSSYDKTTKNKKYQVKGNDTQKGYCAPSCSLSGNGTYDYFTFRPYSPTDEDSCRWTCNNQELDKLVEKLNNDPYYTIPRVSGAYKEAQEHYFRAAFVGKYIKDLRAKGEIIVYDTHKNGETTVNGKPHYLSWYDRCEKYCPIIYDRYFNISNSDNNTFAGFLFYGINPNNHPAPIYATGYPQNKSYKDYRITYYADYENCQIKTDGFDYGNKTSKERIDFHGVGESSVSPEAAYKNRKFLRTWFYYTPKYASQFKNPNDSIELPRTSDNRVDFVRSNTFNWDSVVAGVHIKFDTEFDPLAINLSKDSHKAPESQKPETHLFPLVHEGGLYKNVPVYWPKDSYKFIVNSNFGNHPNVGNMFSDQVSWDGEKYSTGFAQLKAQHDGIKIGNKTTLKDNLITRDEMAGLKLLNRNWTGADTFEDRLEPLTDYVLDINLYNKGVTDEQGNEIQDDTMVYDIQGEYRRLDKKDAKPDHGAVYIGYDRQNLSKELKDEIAKLEVNNQVLELWKSISTEEKYYYYLRSIADNAAAQPYPKQWGTITKKQGMVGTVVDSLPENSIKVYDGCWGWGKYYNDNCKTTYAAGDGKYYVQEGENGTITEYSRGPIYEIGTTQSDFDKYFYNNGQWYKVVTAMITDIIFKVSEE